MRYSTEFRRLAAQITQHWAANKFPKCEQRYVQDVLKDLLKLAKFHDASERIIDQLEDYLKYIREFTKLENALKCQIN